MVKINLIMTEWGLAEADSPVVQVNSVTQLAGRVLDEQGI